MRSKYLSRSLAITLFLLVGMLQTVVAYFSFDRAFDHLYFLEVANQGLEAVPAAGIPWYDFKASAAGFLFWIFTAPSRWMGGGELEHLLWLRMLILIGFLFAFEWVLRTVNVSLDNKSEMKSRNKFMFLCLLYPGQLAWTASLLRDGLSCTLLFAGLLLLSYRKRFFAVFLLAMSLALRPEFALVVLFIYASIWVVKHFDAKSRIVYLLIFCGALSVAGFKYRTATSAFAQLAFGDAGEAYPDVKYWFDLVGYGRVFLQGIIDPIAVNNLSSITPFKLAETIFFVWLLLEALKRLRRADKQTAGLLFGLDISLWLFAYFETFVSGFSRHRMALVILLLAVVTIVKLKQRKSIIFKFYSIESIKVRPGGRRTGERLLDQIVNPKVRED